MMPLERKLNVIFDYDNMAESDLEHCHALNEFKGLENIKRYRSFLFNKGYHTEIKTIHGEKLLIVTKE